MPRFLDTRGHTKLAIAICARCSRKFPYDELRQDPNFPGLYVCDEDLDVLDPWRLAPRESEDITLDHPRPDVGISDSGPMPLWTGGFNVATTGAFWNDGGVLAWLVTAPGIQSDPTGLPPNTVWDDGGAVAIVGPSVAGGATLFWPAVTPQQLITNADSLPTAPGATGLIYNNGGLVCIS